MSGDAKDHRLPPDGEIGPLNLGYAERELVEDGAGDGAPPAAPFRRSIFDPEPRAPLADEELLLERLGRLADAYALRGHESAATDPLADPPPAPRELTPAAFGVRSADLARTVPWRLGDVVSRRSVREVVARLEAAYRGPVAVELGHVRERERRDWLRRRVEGDAVHARPEPAARRALFERLTEVQTLDELVRARFVGAKSYSLEGAETLIVLLDAVVDAAAADGAEDLVLAMTHRGRLNALVNLFEEPPAELLHDLDPDCEEVSGDVRYHLGASVDRRAASGRDVHVSLCFNPSHLEFVAPIALGRARAKQDRSGDRERRRTVCAVVHGDAAFAGQGIVQETLNLDELEAYEVGGALHVVLDNSIGFTTTPAEGRTAADASAAARAIDAPILHVDGNDPEAVLRAFDLAWAWRRRFRASAVVRLRCCRRQGHNELDEPRITQPLLYRRIDATPTAREAYGERLVEEGLLDADEAEATVEGVRERLSDALEEEAAGAEETDPRPTGAWEGYRGGPASERDAPRTGVDAGRAAELLEALTRVPSELEVHRKVERALEARRAMARGEEPLDWAAAEALALASLAAEGVPVRLAGQDTARGTFSQRHAAIVDQRTGRPYLSLAHVAPDQAPVEVVNTPLSEAGALGFEYGYSLDRPDGLVLWEAQYGDFVNAAQVVVDQFIASAEDKWRRLSGLVLLLPHGFEGQGPEHSSARLERFLAACADDNLQVAQPSTPAQLFHVLRRQALSRWRKPLVLMTPKSLLRHRRCTSSLEACAEGAFRPLLGAVDPPEDVARVLLCTGKVAYALEDRLREEERDDVRVLRLEELSPFPAAELAEALAPVADGTPLVWVQEEPENMGAWPAVRERMPAEVAGRLPLRHAARPASASPAAGSQTCHRRQQEELLHNALSGDES